ncbi:MAG: transporter [Gemmatimonadota bacterium]
MTLSTCNANPGCSNRIRRAGLALTMLALSATTAGAQEVHERAEDSHEHADDHDHGLHFAHPIFTESASPDTKIRLDYARTWEEDANENEVEFEAEYAFHRSFSIELVVPYVSLNPDAAPSESNLGNVEVALKFANFAFEDSGVLLGYGVEFGLPTGDDEQGIGSDHLWEIEPFLNLGVKQGDWEIQAFSVFGIPTNQDEGEEIETEFKYDLSTLYHVSDRVQALLELNGEVGLSGDEAGEGVVSLAPGLKVAPLADRSLFLGVGVSLPLGEQEVDATLRVSAFYHF